MADPKKVANNILDFLIDPTRIPVKERVYFRPEENLQNGIYETAKADAVKAYKGQKFNSDFYPNKNRQITQREATLMDRKSLIASFDILSRNFKENDPIGKDLRTMAAAVSKMSDGEFSNRQASDAPDFEGMQVEAKKKAKTFPCPKCGTKVLEQTGYCVKCKKKVKPAKKAMYEEEEDEEEATATKKQEEEMKDEKDSAKKDMNEDEKDATKKDMDDKDEKDAAKKDEDEVEASDFWTKEAMNRVADGLVSEVLGWSEEEDEEATATKKDMDEDEKDAAKMKDEDEEKDAKKKAPKEEEVSSKKKAPKEEDVTAKKEEDDEKDAAKKDEEDEKDATKKLPEDDEEKKSTVDTDILASITFGDISLDAPIIEAGEMTDEEKSKLAGLFN